MLFDLARTHPGVAVDPFVGVKTDVLFFAGALDAVANWGGGFFGSGARDVAVFDGGDFDVKIDAIEERAGNALAITLHLDGTTAAFAFQIAEVSARTGIRPGAHSSVTKRLLGRADLPAGTTERAESMRNRDRDRTGPALRDQFAQ